MMYIYIYIVYMHVCMYVCMYIFIGGKEKRRGSGHEYGRFQRAA